MHLLPSFSPLGLRNSLASATLFPYRLAPNALPFYFVLSFFFFFSLTLLVNQAIPSFMRGLLHISYLFDLGPTDSK